MRSDSKKKALLNLAKKISSELSCELKDSAKHLVFGKGSVDAEIFIIGEAPGKKEDESGLPFVGKSGKLLDDALDEAKISLDNIYIANILKYRPPKNRNPTKKEIQDHTPYLLEQISILKPKILVPLGNYASKFILANCQVSEMKNISPITDLRGTMQKITINNEEFLVFPMFHPSATIYNRKLLEIFKQDFHTLKKQLNKLK